MFDFPHPLGPTIPVKPSCIKKVVLSKKDLKPINNGESDLKVAMKIIAKTNKGPDQQIPSMGCNIKWFN